MIVLILVMKSTCNKKIDSDKIYIFTENLDTWRVGAVPICSPDRRPTLPTAAKFFYFELTEAENCIVKGK